MPLQFLREDGVIALVQDSSIIASITNPETLCVKTESGDKIGIRFTDDRTNTQIRVILSIEGAIELLIMLATSLKE